MLSICCGAEINRDGEEILRGWKGAKNILAKTEIRQRSSTQRVSPAFLGLSWLENESVFGSSWLENVKRQRCTKNGYTVSEKSKEYSLRNKEDNNELWKKHEQFFGSKMTAAVAPEFSLYHFKNLP